MSSHDITPVSGPRLSESADCALLGTAIVLMLGGAILMLAEVVSAAIAIPIITIGIALVAIEQIDKRRGR
jgi:hypothetical protein